VAVSAGRNKRRGSPLNTPIVPASSFVSGVAPHPSATNPFPEYARGDSTETVVAFEAALGALEDGRALAFGSGMAAIAAVLGRFGPGAHIVAPTDLYQGVAFALDEGTRHRGWTVTRLPLNDTEQWCEVASSADLLWLESPSNPLLNVADLPAIGRAANAAGTPLAVDNTFATPLAQQPLHFGATHVVHSVTKYIGGHSDLLAGAVVVDAGNADEYAALASHRVIHGGVIGALEAFLALRGLRTMPLRVGSSSANAQGLAERLAADPRVSEVRYPGLLSHPDHEIARATMRNFGSILSFNLADTASEADQRLERLQLITLATSLGGVETTIERRSKLQGQEHLPPGLVRLSVGIEHLDDLWADLDQALGRSPSKA